MSKQTFSVDDTLFRAQAKKLVKQLKLDETKFVREQAAIYAQTLCKITPPFVSWPNMKKLTYGTAKDLAQGKKAATAGFYSIVKLMTADKQNWKSKSIRAAIKRGDTAYLENRLKYFKSSQKKNLKVRQYSDNRRNKQRDQRGRTFQNATPFVTISRAEANAGLKRAQDNVGLAKAVLAKAAIRLGRKGKAPVKGISRHLKNVHAAVTVTKNPSTAGFTVKSHGLDVTARRLKEAESFRLKGMVLKLKRDLRARIKQNGF